MPLNVYHGNRAFIGFATTSSSNAPTPIGGLRNYTLTLSADVVDVISVDSSGWIEALPNNRRWSLTAETLLYISTADTQQEDVRDAFSSAVRRYAWISPASSGNRQEQKGWSYITGWDWNGDVNDVQLHNFSITGDGKLTESTV